MPFLAGFPSNKVTAEFNHQHDYFSEHLHPCFPDPLHKRIVSTTFVDTNHGHNTATIKATVGFLSLVTNTPADCGAPRQASVKTAAHGTELNALKLTVEYDVDIR